MLLKIDTFCIVRTASNSLYLKKRQVKKGEEFSPRPERREKTHGVERH